MDQIKAVYQGNFDLLEKGMIITIEPGLYKDKYFWIALKNTFLGVKKFSQLLSLFYGLRLY